MHDQANQLRRLVRRAATAAAGPPPPRSKLVTVAGGKGGVGTTTVAINLALELARGGRRILLLDADPDGGDVAVYCGLDEPYTISDVASGRRSAGEALAAGPGGLAILPGAWAIESLAELPDAARARLAQQVETLKPHYDLIVADAGNGRSSLARWLWEAAGQIVVVTTTELASVMDAYGSIKVLAGKAAPARIHALVNRATSPPAANDAQRRLVEAAARFLGAEISSLGYLGEDPQVPESIATRRPLVLSAPQCQVARQICRAAAKLAVPQQADVVRANAPKTVKLPERRAG